MDIGRALLTLRLILAALSCGIVVFTGVAMYLVTGGRVHIDPQPAGVLLPVLGGAALVELVAYLVLRRVFMSRLRKWWQGGAVADRRPERLIGPLFVLTIIGGALAEGVSFFGTTVFFMTGTWAALFGPILGLLALTLLFPTRDRFDRFVAHVEEAEWR